MPKTTVDEDDPYFKREEEYLVLLTEQDMALLRDGEPVTAPINLNSEIRLIREEDYRG